MVDRVERITTLQSLGLTENQAKAYVALLDMGRASASALNKLSGVPRNKVYSVVEELNEKGLVDVVLEDPIVFVPRPIGGFLDLLMAALEDRRTNLAAQQDELAQRFRPRPVRHEQDLEVGTFRLFRGRRAVMHQLRRMNRDARSDVRAILSRRAAERFVKAGVGRDFDREEGESPRVELFTPMDEDNAPAVERLHQLVGDTVRVSADMPEGLLVKQVDGKEAMFVHFLPDSDSLTAGDDIAVWTDNPVFIQLADGLFRLAAVGSHSVPSARSLLKGDGPSRFEVVQDPERLHKLVFGLIEEANEVALAMPAGDVHLAFTTFADAAERERLRAGKRRIRILTDLPEAEIRRFDWGPRTEVRRIRPLPARIAIFDDHMMRSHDLDQTGTAFFGDLGVVVVSSGVESAVREAKDHFERLWAEGAPVSGVGAADRDAAVAQSAS